MPAASAGGTAGGDQSRGRLGTVEVVALEQADAMGLQRRQHLGVLHPFRHQLEVHLPGQTGHHRHDLAGHRIAAEGHHKGFVDLDLVGSQGAQQAERGVAGAEIVEGEAVALAAELFEVGLRSRVALQNRGLGDLQSDQLGGMPASRSMAASRSCSSGSLSWLGLMLVERRSWGSCCASRMAQKPSRERAKI